MPSLAEATESAVVKLLNCADSGSGKTGSLASLIDAGYNVRILAFDCKVSTIAGFVKDKSKLANVHFIELRDEMQLVGGKLILKKVSGFQRAMDALDKGGDLWGAGSAIPPVSQWTSRDILVIDTLAQAGRASLQMVMQANGAAMKHPEIQHYGTAMENIEKLVGQLTSPLLPCHVIVNTHLSPASDNGLKFYPEALGSKLNPKVPRYFDNMVTMSVGMDGKTRKFKTDKDGLFLCKTARPVKPEYPIETGLRDLFEDLLGRKTSEILAS